MMLLVPGRMEWGHIHCNQGHGAVQGTRVTLCGNTLQISQEQKAVV